MMGDPKGQVTNRRNRANGALFEKYIEAACGYYWSKGCACIEKTPERMEADGPDVRA